MARLLVITVLSVLAGVATCFAGAYGVLVFGPDIDAPLIGF